MSDYIPPADDEFDTFLRDHFGPYLANNFLALGLTAAENLLLQNALVAWGYAWVGFTNADAALTAATIEKGLKRATVETIMRTLAGKVQSNTTVTDTQRAGLGITVRKTTKTPVGVPATVPVLTRADTSTRCILRLFYTDATTPDSKAKPPGVQGCEVREQIGGTAPVNPNTMAFLALETRAPYRADFEATDAGKTVYLAFRWVNTKGQPGPWSMVYNAVVPG